VLRSTRIVNAELAASAEGTFAAATSCASGDIEPETSSRSLGGGAFSLQTASDRYTLALHPSDVSLAPDPNQRNDSAWPTLDTNGAGSLTCLMAVRLACLLSHSVAERSHEHAIDVDDRTHVRPDGPHQRRVFRGERLESVIFPLLASLKITRAELKSRLKVMAVTG
jgi:hypothetical protein